MAIDFKVLIGEHNDHRTPCPVCRAEGALRGADQWIRENSIDFEDFDRAYARFAARLMAAGVFWS